MSWFHERFTNQHMSDQYVISTNSRLLFLWTDRKISSDWMRLMKGAASASTRPAISLRQLCAIAGSNGSIAAQESAGVDPGAASAAG